MGFASLSSSQQILVRLYLLGGPKYRAELEKAGLVTKSYTTANTALGRALEKTNKRSFLQNQLLFTARRAMFYTTLGAIGLTAEIIKMGFAYDNAMQSANVALGQVIKPQRVLTSELQKLFLIAAQTPFQVKDITVAFRQMFISFKPFHVSMKTLNDTISAITDNLSATGKVTPAALQRVSIALSHMANIGHLTGQAVQQLARDGLQLQPALRKELHLTSDQLQNLGKAGIPARDVLIALIKYSKSTPGIAGAAFRQANMTLAGSFTSLKDYIAQASGGALGGPGGTKGIFGTLQQNIKGVNKELGNLARAGKPITLLEIAKAIDKQLTPNTHAIINLFILLTAAIKTLFTVFFTMFKVIGLLFWPINKLTGLFGANYAAAKILGVVLGILGTVLIIGTTLWGGYRLAVDAARGVMLAVRGAITLVTAAMAIQDGLIAGEGLAALGSRLKLLKEWAHFKEPIKAAGGWNRIPNPDQEFARQGIVARSIRALFAADIFANVTAGAKNFLKVLKDGGFKGALKLIATGILGVGRAMWGLIPGFISLIALSWELFIANLWWAWIPIVILLVIGVLVLLYRKWQWFHDLVNHGARFIKKYWIYFTLFIGLAVFAVAELVKHWGFFANIINTVVDALKRVVHWIGRLPSRIPFLGTLLHVAGVIGGAIGGAAHWLTSSNVHATKAAGGYTFGGGNVLVGEKGPEIVNLPGGSNVIPNSQLSVRPVNWNGGNGNGDNRPIVVQVMLDRKVLAEGVARANQDYAARR